MKFSDNTEDSGNNAKFLVAPIIKSVLNQKKNRIYSFNDNFYSYYSSIIITTVIDY